MNQPAMSVSLAFAPHAFNPEILREYDIRGIAGKTLFPADAYALGRAFGTFVRRKTGGNRVCVGYDGRHSSPALKESLCRGLLEAGMAIESVGLGPTPMLWFAVKDLGADAGVMVTGSHNPADYNGFKLTLRSGPVYGEMVQELGRMAAAADFEAGAGSYREIDIRDRYVDRLLRDTAFKPPHDLKVAWDCGNGAAGEIVRRLTARLPGTHTLLFDEIDGSFPNHHPDPTVDKNMADLARAVKTGGCDLGIAFDGDGDRVGAVDETGTILRCDMLMTVYARDVLSRHPGAAIIGDVKCSQVMFDEIARMGGKPVMWKTGHSLIKAKMMETGAPLAGELSGHIFFGDGWYGFDDGLYCAVRLLDAVIGAGAALSSLMAGLPPIVNTPEIRFEVDESRKFALVANLVASVKARAAKDPAITLNDIDGARVSTPDGWWLVRASNTQNVLVMRAEAATDDGLSRVRGMALEELGKIGLTASFDSAH